MKYACLAHIEPVLDRIKKFDSSRKIVVAVDGRAASGKTTLANSLKSAVGAEIVHMDDFFLPLNLRTKERFKTAGANVHYERFAKEVLPYIRQNSDFSYRKFSCSKMDFDSVVQVKNSPVVIVEGAYSCHPILGKYYDFSVFSDVEKSEQMRRIILRDGKEKAEMFQKRWIPLEEEYFKAYKIAEKCDILI